MMLKEKKQKIQKKHTTFIAFELRIPILFLKLRKTSLKANLVVSHNWLNFVMLMSHVF